MAVPVSLGLTSEDNVISGVLEIADPFKLAGVTWMPWNGCCAVTFGWYGPVEDHEIVGVEPWDIKANVYILHACSQARLDELGRGAIWLKGESAAKNEAIVEGWQWPQNEYSFELGPVIKVDKEVPTIAGGERLKTAPATVLP